MTIKRRNTFFATAAAVLVAAVCLFLSRRGIDTPEPNKGDDAHQTAAQERREERARRRAAKSGTDEGIPRERRARLPQDAKRRTIDVKAIEAAKRRIPVVPREAQPKPKLSPEGQRLVAAIDAAYDKDDLAATLRLYEEARDFPEPPVRSSIVWSLGWFGKAAIKQLAEFLADDDAEVANEALGQWNSAIQEVTDEGEKVKLIEDAMERITDPEALEDVALEYVGIDEKVAVESLLRVLSGGNQAAAAQALETYESLTGEPFTSKAAAYQWLLRQDQD